MSLEFKIVTFLVILLTSCQALTPTFGTSAESTFVSRRSAALSIVSSVFALPVSVLATDEVKESEKEAAEAAKERMRQRIADSKNNYRKSSDLVKQRKDTTDYSCVSTTGSPCPEGLVPRAVQREIVGVLEKSGISN